MDAVHEAGSIVEAMRLADDLALEASREPGGRTLRVLTAAIDDSDEVTAIAAVHALGHVFGDDADRTLSRLLSGDRPFLSDHVAWVLGSRLPHFASVGRLLGMVVRGGFGGMIAQRSLELWAQTSPEHIAVATESALLGIEAPDARYRLIETLGLVDGAAPARVLLEVAADTGEDLLVRSAAIAALGQRRGDARVAALLDDLACAADDAQLAATAQLALIDLAGGPIRTGSADAPFTVAQLFLHADVDAGLNAAGSGDNGGVATLLVRLGDALVREGGPGTRVVTMSRGSVESAIDSVTHIASGAAGHHYGRIPLLTPTQSSATAWPQRVAARRGIRRLLRAAGEVDLIHLRMAEVGSLAASDVARELDLPVVFTVAPDPHAVIHSLETAGSLTRSSFGEADAREHFWFRARLVQRLASNANHTVLFPRPELRRDMRTLVGIDIAAHPERHTIVPEGIDLPSVDAAVHDATAHAGGATAAGPLAELRALVETLPPERRGLPLIVSAGRLHRVKGMAAIVAAWQAGSADRANLLLVGGDLARPSADEREQLAAIDAIVPPAEHAARGLLLPGHRPNDTVARWMAAARLGLPGLAAAGGVYVCGSVKEEFGLALLEAMAAGLFVVAPDGGGPATYVDDGDTGILTRTADPAALAAAMGRALDIAAAEPAGANAAQTAAQPTPERAARSRAVVERRFTVQAMAAALDEVYRRVRTENAEAEAAVSVA